MKHDLSTISQLIQKIISKSPHNHKSKELAVISAWEKILSPQIVKQTENIFLKKDVLFVKVKSSILKRYLQDNRENVIEKLKEHNIEVKNITLI